MRRGADKWLDMMLGFIVIIYAFVKFCVRADN